MLHGMASSIAVVRRSCWKNWKNDKREGRRLRSTFLSNMTERNKHHENSPGISHFQSLTQNWCVILFLLPIFDSSRIPFISSVMLAFCWSHQIYPYASFFIFTFSFKPRAFWVIRWKRSHPPPTKKNCFRWAWPRQPSPPTSAKWARWYLFQKSKTAFKNQVLMILKMKLMIVMMVKGDYKNYKKIQYK